MDPGIARRARPQGSRDAKSCSSIVRTTRLGRVQRFPGNYILRAYPANVAELQPCSCDRSRRLSGQSTPRSAAWPRLSHRCVQVGQPPLPTMTSAHMANGQQRHEKPLGTHVMSLSTWASKARLIGGMILPGVEESI